MMKGIKMSWSWEEIALLAIGLVAVIFWVRLIKSTIGSVAKFLQKRKDRIFTIEVKKRERDEKFSFDDIRNTTSIFHENCWDSEGVRGGTIWEDRKDPYGDIHLRWIFTCERCKKCTFIYYGNMDETKAKLVQTAIDGKKRKILEDICVIQKT